MAEPAPTLLVSQAAKISEAIFCAIKRKRLKPSDLESFRIAGEVAAKLHLISTYMSSLPLYWIEPEVEQLCCTMLGALPVITQPTKGPSFRAFWNKPTDPETNLVVFFRQQTQDAQNFKTTCDNLLGKLTKNENGAIELPSSALQLNPPAAWDDLNDNVFKTLQLIASCNPSLHESNDTISASQKNFSELRHQARLCLHDPGIDDSASRNIAILVSATNMAIWQEFFLRIQLEGSVDDEQQTLEPGGFCPILENDYTARLILEFKHGHGLSLKKQAEVLNQILQPGPGLSLNSVICDYELTPKDKVICSYAVARSYYEYYDSELMKIKWTSDAIWFMNEEGRSGQEDQLPLRAYIPLPSGLTNSIPLDVTDEELLIHGCPRIFDLGVLLLEIGLSKSFRILERRNKVSQANLNHKRAMDELEKLESLDWDGFTHKNYVDSAIRFCLDSKNFIPPKQNRQGVVVPVPTWHGKEGILERRRMLYKHVVRPLEFLVKRGFKVESNDLIYVGKKPNPSSQRAGSDTLLSSEPEALFHSHLIPKMWLTNIKKISEQVERKRREHRVTTPVRVAILDTGLNREFPAFKTNSGLIKTVTDEQDFVKSGTPTTMDTFGHGTLMARLIMECAPSVELLVVRVAERTTGLQGSQDNIKNAILWAGQAGKADIISMSFGFSSDDQGIRDALETVHKSRGENIIFFASAGNLSSDDESFPARHPDVLSVQATDCHGAFLRSNSASTTNGAAVLGTYGDDIPDFIREEFRTMYPDVCQPGSSVATAVMAGIAATMLAYASVLPSLISLQGVAASTGNRVLKRLRTAKGMEAVLHRLAQEDFDHPRLKAVNPTWFWKSRPSDAQRYFAIVDTLSDVDRRSPRMTRTG